MIRSGVTPVIIQAARKKGLGSCQVRRVTQAHVHEIPISSEGAVDIAPASRYADGRFVHLPTSAHSTASLLAPCLAASRCERPLPIPHDYMGEDQAPMEKHRGPIPPTQVIAAAPQRHQAHHSGGRGEAMEQCPRPFVKDTTAVAIAETAIAQCGAIRALADGGRLTAGACHRHLPLSPRSLQVQPWKTKVA